MPYKDQKKRRKWERSPQQQDKNAERQARHRKKVDNITPLVTVYRMTLQSGKDLDDLACCGPVLRQRVKDNLPAIQARIKKENAATIAANKAYLKSESLKKP